MAGLFLLSPTEQDLAEKLGDDAVTSSLPEQKGADILIYSKHGVYGIQRKKLPHDFLLSVGDGRLTRETTLMPKELDFWELLCEGRFRYYPDGRLAVDRKEPSRFTRKQIRGILFDVKWVKGVPVEYTEDIDDTVNYIKGLHGLLNADTHTGLFRRPSLKSAWYIPSIEEIHSWILQSWNGIGPATAEAIINHFGGIPLQWTCTLDQMSRVPKLSRNKAKELIDTLTSGGSPPPQLVKKETEFDRMRRMLKGGH